MKIEVEIDDDILELVQLAIAANTGLTLQVLVLVLLTDVAMSISQPLTWNGGNMRSLLKEHGINI